ncbi:hypothetical protein OIU76_009775 [Salix suchowensis]|nr:hypothetical protein OIU76_009775 [Salix suchowensis]
MDPYNKREKKSSAFGRASNSIVDRSSLAYQTDTEKKKKKKKKDGLHRVLVTSVPRPNRQFVTGALLFSHGKNICAVWDGNTGNQRELLQLVLIRPLLPISTPPKWKRKVNLFRNRWQ